MHSNSSYEKMHEKIQYDDIMVSLNYSFSKKINELQKLGTETEITDLTIQSLAFKDAEENISIKTYQDHRMAMSFAPFCLIKELNIEDENVVEKSYPMFWEDLKNILTN